MAEGCGQSHRIDPDERDRAMKGDRRVRCRDCGKRLRLTEAKLSSKVRNDLPASAFVFPKERRYPIHDESHARNALARSSGKPEESNVRAAVYRRYPTLKSG